MDYKGCPECDPIIQHLLIRLDRTERKLILCSAIIDQAIEQKKGVRNDNQEEQEALPDV